MDAYIDQYFGFISPEFVPVIVDAEGQDGRVWGDAPLTVESAAAAKGRLFPFGLLHISCGR